MQIITRVCRRLVAGAALVALVMLAAVSALADPARPPRVQHCPGEFTGLTSGRVSLFTFAARHAATISDVLIVTYGCTPGFPVSLQNYLNRGNDRLLIPKGIRLYAAAF